MAMVTLKREGAVAADAPAKRLRAGDVVAADNADTDEKEDAAQLLGARLLRACECGDLNAADALLTQMDRLAATHLGDCALVAACWDGDVQLVARMLAAGADPDASNDALETALGVAAGRGHVDVVRMLLHAGAGVSLRFHVADCTPWCYWEPYDYGFNHDETTALQVACANGHVEVAFILILEGGATVDDFSLLAACGSGCADLVETLLTMGANAGCHDGWALHIAAQRGHVAVVGLLLQAGAGQHTLHLDNLFLEVASQHTHWYGKVSLPQHGVAVVRLLLEAGADVHFKEDIALIAACFAGNTAMVKLLLAAGAHVGAHNHRALVDACSIMSFGVVGALIAAGANVRAAGPEALQSACAVYGYSHRSHMAALLVRAGADVAHVPWTWLNVHEQLRVLCSVWPVRFRTLPTVQQVQWLRYVLRPRLRLLRALHRARVRLDRPPSAPLGSGTPTRETLIAHLQTGGRRFARDYWTDGLPIFFPSLDLGPVPDLFRNLVFTR